MSTNQYAKTKIIMLLEVEENKVAGYKLYYRKTLCFEILNLPKRISRQSHVKHAK